MRRTSITHTIAYGIILAYTFFAPTSFAKTSTLPVEELQRFTSVIENIKYYYVNETEDAKLLESAIRGMLVGLDPHSAYLDKKDFADLQTGTTGKFGGLGIEVVMEEGFVRVISPIDDTPAQKAGVLAGDIVVMLDDAAVKGLTLREAVDMMRGKPGTNIKLTIIREGETQPLHIQITRAIINVQSVKEKLLESDYGYLRVSQFQTDTGDELLASLKTLKKKNKRELKGIVLDLRNNPGGVVDSCVQIADAFLDRSKLKYEGMIVYTKGRLSGSQIKEVAKSGDVLKGAPIVVLVNSGSASAAEIVAGALQDHRRAIIVGNNTFGKGSVQTILPLKDDRGLKLTTALYYTPSGRSIQATGITPDVIIENVQLPEPKNKELTSLFSFKEKDLQGHLENGKKGQPTPLGAKESKPSEETSNLLYEDYQLNQALMMLKGLHLLREG